ncbi:DUF2141 domain-containing protein [bacterium]|nr:DUF2141 domain-containing protein [bacterium]
MNKIIVLACLVASLSSVLAQDVVTYVVSGSIEFPKTGNIHIKLQTNQSEGEKTDKFSKVITVNTQQAKLGKIRFSIENIPAGTYGIRAYQDVNGNDELDIGIMGPKEPWGTYKHSRPRFSGPKFKDMAFEVDSNLVDVNFKLK